MTSTTELDRTLSEDMDWQGAAQFPVPPTRIEEDALGPVAVPADSLWGAQTQRAILNFPVGVEHFKWGRPVIRSLGIIKKCAAIANAKLEQLPQETADHIIAAAQEVIDGRWDNQFPLVVFQSGSGSQSNINANEVIANLAARSFHPNPIHPNDDVNRGQSSNDVFPAVMHITTVEQLEHVLIPAVRVLRDTLLQKSKAYSGVMMLGRTHLEDAVALTLGDVISGWVSQLDDCTAAIRSVFPMLCELALGGTAVGTGLNAHPRFGEVVAHVIAQETGSRFTSAPNKFAALSAHDAMVTASGTLRTLAGASMKIANDIRWYASGPRGGIGELRIPGNELGSSIMPGKINPTQCECLTQVAVQVFGNDHAVAFAGSQGNFQLNAYKPVILHNVLESISLLASACRSFEERCARGIEPVMERIQEHLDEDLTIVTSLSPYIGYEKATQIALVSSRDGIPFREAAIKLGFLSAERFDQLFRR